MSTKWLNRIAIAFIFVVSLALTTSSFAKDKKNVDVKANKVENSRGENPNITVDRPTTDEKAMEKPAQSRGEYCEVSFQNDCGYYVDIYLDGTFMGTISPYQTSVLTAYSGYKKIYAVTAGKSYDWAFEGNCDGYFSYRLYIP